MQGGKPLLWTIAGALDFFESSYNCRFFTDIHFLALVCNPRDLEKRMREGRHIDDSNWIQGSIDYNRWFMENGIVSDRKVDTYDITGKNVSEVAKWCLFYRQCYCGARGCYREGGITYDINILQ